MPGLEESENQYRYRVREPGLFREGSLRTKRLSGVKGVSIIAGKLKNPPEGQSGSLVVQAYRFNKDDWTKERVRKWISEHL